VVAYTGQIYCDFSGYTDIARGASMMLGYPLPENFRTPYLSTSITEFWRRWHMTLSRWLRDYLYVPLGGNRGGQLLQYRNLMLTMLLGGLWHGANWTFVVWGALHGVALALHKPWTELGDRAFPRLRTTFIYRLFAWAVTMLVVMLGWVLFRAPDFATAQRVASRLFTPTSGIGEAILASSLPDPMMLALRVIAVLAFGHLLATQSTALELHRRAPPFGRGLVWVALIALCFLFAESRAQFIYFQF
jgi:D-alanyl-lipoteichoic acid acyltransferase DltB (MBOAT superfamily)